jgi:hypothetical protein
VISKGSAFIWEGHVWFILSDPKRHSGQVLCVNITTLDEECPDDECLLNPSDYGWIKHASVAAFSRARVFKLVNLIEAINKGLLKQPVPNLIPLKTIQKIIICARCSRELSADKKKFLD